MRLELEGGGVLLLETGDALLREILLVSPVVKIQLLEQGRLGSDDVTEIGRIIYSKKLDEYGMLFIDETYKFDSGALSIGVKSTSDRYVEYERTSSLLVGTDVSASFRNVEYIRTSEISVGAKSTASRLVEWIRTALVKVYATVRASFISTFRTARKPLIEVYVYRFVGVSPGVDTDGEEYKFISGGGSASRWNPTTREGAGIVSCGTNFGYDQISAAASIVIQSPLDLDGNLVTFKPMDRVVVKQGWDSLSDLETTFYGFVDQVELSNPEKLQRLECRDILKLAQNNYYLQEDRKIYSVNSISDELDADGNPLGGQSEANRQIEVVISTFLTESGIPESRQNLATTNITLASNADNHVEFVNETAMDAIQRMCDYIGYKVWADRQGVVQMREVQTIASSGMALTLQTQLEYHDGDTFIRQRKGNIISLKSNVDDDLRNWVKVTYADDPNISAKVIGDSPYVSNPPRYRKTEIISYMLDTQDMVDTIALRLYSDLNRLRYSADVRVEGNQRLELGETVSVLDDYTVGSGGMNYFVYDYSSQHDSNGYFTDIVLVGGTGDGSAAVGNISPVALFEFIPEKITVAGVDYYDLWVDGSKSYDPDGSIASYTWTTSGFATQYGELASYLIPATQTIVTVTLVVVDDDGLSDSMVQTKSLDALGGANVKERSIYYAEGTKVYYTDDSGANWNSFDLE